MFKMSNLDRDVNALASELDLREAYLAREPRDNNEPIFFQKIKFLKWQPCHFPVMAICSKGRRDYRMPSKWTISRLS